MNSILCNLLVTCWQSMQLLLSVLTDQGSQDFPSVFYADKQTELRWHWLGFLAGTHVCFVQGRLVHIRVHCNQIIVVLLTPGATHVVQLSSAPSRSDHSSMQASLQGRHHLSALLGALAVSFRQTNAVWVAFILGAAVVRWAAGGGDAMAGAEKKDAILKFERALPGRQLLHVMRMAWLVSVLTLFLCRSRGCTQ